MSIYFFYDSTKFTGVGAATVPAARSGVANAYNQVPSGTPMVPGPGTCSSVGPPVQCNSIAPGIGRLVGYIVPCNGQVMLYAGSCQLNYAGTLPGQTAWIDPVTISEDFSLFISDTTGNPIRGIDMNTFDPSPSSNVRGWVIFH